MRHQMIGSRENIPTSMPWSRNAPDGTGLITFALATLSLEGRDMKSIKFSK